MERAAETSTPGRRVVAGWLAAYAILSLLFCAPFVRLTTLDRTPDRGDARLITWLLAWHAHWPLTGESPLDAPVFAPEPGALGASDPMIALGLAAAPLTALAGPVAAFNLVRLLLPVLNALAMAWLAWHLLRDAWAAFAAGLVLAFSYSQIAAIYLGMLNLGVLAGFALTPLFLDRWWQSGRRRDLGAAVGTACLQALVSWYAAVLVVIVVLVQVAWYVIADPGTAADLRRRLLALATTGAVAGALLWPLARPVLGLPAPTLEELRLYAVQPEFYVTPPRLYPDSERTMGFDVGATGLRIVLDAQVPAVVNHYIRDDVDAFLGRHGLTRADIGWWVCHPGGPKVIEALESALDVPREAVQLTWDSLARIGNLSSASVLHVLADTLRERPPGPGSWGVLLAMGPGFCSELVLLRAPEEPA